MKTISTLCATSTIGAAAVGVAFGCIPHKPSTSSSDRAQDNRRHPARSASAPLQKTIDLDRPRPTSSYEPFHSSSALHLHPDQQRPATSSGIGGGANGASIDSYQTAGAGNSFLEPSQKSRLIVRRRRPGSSIGSEPGPGQQQERGKDSRPGYTQDSSTDRDRKAKALGSTKLLKRKSTTRSLSNPLLGPAQLLGANQARDTEQRATTFAYGTSQAPGPDVTGAAGPQEVIEEQFKPYFRTLAEHSSVRANTGRAIEQQSECIRQIAPNSAFAPILVKFEELAPKPRRRLPKSRAEKRRSILSFDFSSYFGSSTTEPVENERQVSRPKHRRSFSISDMLANVSLTRKSSDEPKIPRRKLQRPPDHRTASTPILSTRHDSISGTNILLSVDARSEHARSLSAVASYTRSTSHSEDPIGVPFTTASFITMNNAQSVTAEPIVSPLPAIASPSVPPTATESGDSMIRPSYQSTAPSEFTSSQIGSDMDNRVFSSGEEDEADFKSDTAYDSVRTGMTRDSLNFPGSLFDKDEGRRSRATSLQEISGSGSPTTARAYDDIILEEDENATTPKRVITSSRTSDIQQRLSYQTMIERKDSTSPTTKQALNLGKLDWDDDFEDDWSNFGGEAASKGTTGETLNVVKRAEEPLADLQDDTDVSFDWAGDSVMPHPYDHRKLRHPDINGDSKSSLFDWSEQPVLERNHSDFPIRPKTVHGNKKNGSGRNSRPDSRRAPSGPHARSQSVPAVMNDQTEPRASVASKFGTWGVGMKGATEDWDDDFDFDIPAVLPAVSDTKSEARTDSAIVVPQTIREQQTSVLANIGLLKEWGVLIEELKELRLRATRMGLTDSHAQDVFDEVDAMIDLADQEVDEPQFPSEQAASAQWPDESETNSRRQSTATSIASPSAEDDVFGPLPSPTPPSTLPSPNRPRKNSQAIARSVIEAVQHKRDRKLSIPNTTPVKPNSKVPFDKGTLRHILPHLQGLVKSMKTILRDADSFGISPERRPTPAFSQAFITPSDSPSRRCTSPHERHSPLRDGLTQILSS